MKGYSWREFLVQKIKKSMERVIILRSSQNFLEDQILCEMIRSEGSLCECNDSIDIFRCIQESQKQKVVIQVQPTTNVPYGVQINAKDIEFTSEEIFSSLNPEVIRKCGIETFDAIFDYYSSLKPSYVPLTKRQTEELVVQALFSLDLNRINFESCLAVFLMLYNRAYHLPPELIECIRKLGDENGRTRRITFLNKVPSEKELKDWVSEQWQLFLSKDENAQLDFSDPSIRLLLPTLFTSGVLRREKIRSLEQLERFTERFSDYPWLMMGLELSFFDKRQARSAIRSRLEVFENMVSDISKQPTAEKWLEVAQQWGQIRYLEYRSGVYLEPGIRRISHQIEKAFREYVTKNYDGIIIGSTDSHPLSVDKVLPNISKQVNYGDKVALLLFDGMGIDQWEMLKTYLTSHSLEIKRECYVYAMLPTLTGYSRQSVFSGRTPNEFKRFRMTTHEKSLFNNFWLSKSIASREILYIHLVPDPTILEKPDESMSEFLTAVNEGKQVIGVIFTFIDKRLHDSYDLDVGKKLLYSSIEDFLKSSCLAEIFEALLKGGYKVYLTSDHGNLVATGNGVSDSKYIVEMHGKRCLVYDSRILAEEKQKEADVTLFLSRFIPKDQHILFPNGNYFFGTDGAKEITHGGISIEEMIVPFVEVEK